MYQISPVNPPTPLPTSFRSKTRRDNVILFLNCNPTTELFFFDVVLIRCEIVMKWSGQISYGTRNSTFFPWIHWKIQQKFLHTKLFFMLGNEKFSQFICWKWNEKWFFIHWNCISMHDLSHSMWYHSPYPFATYIPQRNFQNFVQPYIYIYIYIRIL